MTHKNTIEIISANAAAIFISLKDFNELLTTISLILAIGFTIYKISNDIKK